MERLDWTHGGTLPIGDKSAPEEIQRELPGVSKATFKKAVSSLYKQGKVQPGPFFIKLMTLTDDKD
jgi:predicted RNA-binding protein (virulence factor B family)